MARNAKVIVLVCLLVSAAATAKLQIVRLKGSDSTPGGSIVGEVQETEDGYYVKVGSNSVIAFTKDQVESIEDYLSPTEEYLKRRKEANPNEPEELLDLARWGFLQNDVDVLKLALEDLDKAMKLIANYEEAEILTRQIKGKIDKLTSPTTSNDEGLEKDTRLRIPDDWLISKEDINRVRLAEMKLKGKDDNRVGVIFHNGLIDRFIKDMEGEKGFENEEDVRRFRAMKPADQLQIIKGNNIERYADDIEIRSDPKVIRDFRSLVWPIVSRRCATKDCHGSPKTAPGGLKLFDIGTKRDERVAYTNFVIMDGFINSRGERLIDRSDADSSLLLQFCLPMSKAKHPEPFKKSILFRSKNDNGYRINKAWIESLNGPIHPRYNLEYKPPLGMEIKYDSGALDIKQGVGKQADTEKLPAEPNEPAGDKDKEKESPTNSREKSDATNNTTDASGEVISE